MGCQNKLSLASLKDFKFKDVNPQEKNRWTHETIKAPQHLHGCYSEEDIDNTKLRITFDQETTTSNTERVQVENMRAVSLDDHLDRVICPQHLYGGHSDEDTDYLCSRMSQGS